MFVNHNHNPKVNRTRIVLFALLAVLVLSFSLVALNGCVVEAQDHGGASSDSTSQTSDIYLEQIPDDEAMTEEEQIDAAIQSKIDEMSLVEKVSQMVVVCPEDVTEDETMFTEAGAENLSNYPFGGVCYFKDNISSSSQLKSFIEDFKEASTMSGANIPMFITTDEEGGGLAYPGADGALSKGIARLVAAGLPDVTALYPMFYYKDEETQIAFDNAATIADYLEDYGFNWDFAPVADTNSNPDNPIIGVRAYSDDFSQTAELVSSAVQGFKSENMACTLKHFPGHGDTETDTHEGSAVIDDKDYYALKSQELVPFAAGIEAGADAVMMGHITAVAVDDVPASMSKQWIEVILRDEMQFDGVIVTDGLNMGALTNTYTNDEIALSCVNAGCDILLIPEDPYSAVDAVVEAVAKGEITEAEIDEHVKRILTMKNKHGIWDAMANSNNTEQE